MLTLPVVSVTVTVVALLLLLPGELPLLDSGGPLVVTGQPVARGILDAAFTFVLGSLTLAVFVLPSGKGRRAALDLAATAAGVGTAAAAAGGFLSFLALAGPFSPDVLLPALGQYVTTVELGRAWLLTAVAQAVLTVLCLAVDRPTGIAIVTVLAFASLIPLALQGHAAGAGSHSAAFSALWLHVAAAAVWAGGLAVLAYLYARRKLPDPVTAIVERYSSIALIAFVAVALSGTISATLRLTTFEQLFTTPYGMLLALKIVLFAVLGVVGAFHRRWLLNRMAAGSNQVAQLFWRLVAGELVLLGAAMGLASALGRTASPGTEQLAVTAAERLTGQDPPAVFSWPRAIDSWAADPIWLVAALLGVAIYLAGVVRLRRRGDRWPIRRTVSWIAAMVVLLYATNGAPGVYGPFLFSAHMVGHMILSMVIPILMVGGAPVTLALRALRPRSDDSRGPREWLLRALHSRVARVLTHPLAAAALFAGSLVAFYYTPLFQWALEDPIGHQWMTAHFLIVGFLFVSTLVGIDPIPYRFDYPLRLFTLLVTMAFHAFFGLTLITGTELLLPSWYGAIAADWGVDPLADQQTAGGVAWGIGEIPTLVLALIVAIQWSRSDERISRRLDRAADRDNDQELRRYNDNLQRLSESR